MAFDRASRQLLLFGGMGAGGFPAGTWALTRAGWRRLASAHEPRPRYGASMASDNAAGEVVLFGGNEGRKLSSTTWVWSTGSAPLAGT
jgi:hypothetical protein